jgi:hypothetical protein
MRRAFILCAGLAVLGGCTVADHNRVVATSPVPPTVSYRIAGNDISQASASAAQYCQRYGTGAQYQGLQASPSGNVAVYSCGGAPAALSGSSVAPYGSPYAAAPAPAVLCADSLHQNRPGGTDYYGPPVAGCPVSP